MVGDLNVIGNLISKGVNILNDTVRTTQSSVILASSKHGTVVLVYSTDGGITWTPTQNHPFTTNIISFGNNGTYLLAGSSGYGETGAVMAYSTNGIAWVPVTAGLPAVGASVKFIYWENNTWVASISSEIYTSSDGLNWTKSTVGLQPSHPQCIAYGQGKFIVGGLSNTLYVSQDGKTWATSTNMASVHSGSAINSIGFNGSIWVAGTGLGSNYTVFYSSDGITWSPSTSGTSAIGTTDQYGPYVYSISSNGSVWLMGGYTATGMVYSTDGINWSTIPGLTSFGIDTIQSITYNGSLFIATVSKTNHFAPYTNSKVLTSPDGLNWTANSSAATYLTDSNGQFYLSPGSYNSKVTLLNNNLLDLASVPYTPATAANWASPAPTNLASAVNRLAAAVAGLLTTAIP